MKYELKICCAFPCVASKFTVNGIRADKNDFGNSESESDGQRGCKYNIFKPFRYPPEGVLEKYKISLEEFLRIGDILESEFCIHHCNWRL